MQLLKTTRYQQNVGVFDNYLGTFTDVERPLYLARSSVAFWQCGKKRDAFKVLAVRNGREMGRGEASASVIWQGKVLHFLSGRQGEERENNPEYAIMHIYIMPGHLQACWVSPLLAEQSLEM